MTLKMAIHEIKDHLSSVIAELAETGEAVEITKHGRVVAILVPPPAAGVILGLGVRPDVRTPTIDDLRWNADEIRDMFGASTFPK